MNRPGSNLIRTWLVEGKKFAPDLRMADLEEWAKRRNPQPVDVIVTQKSVLQRNSRTRQVLESVGFKYLIVDECHDWVRGRPSETSNQLNFLRSNLSPRADAVFFLSGTPFVGCMQFDVIETIKSLATPTRRAVWKAQLNMNPDRQETTAVCCYTDEWLRRLDKQWKDTSHLVKTQMLFPILLIRTPNTLIDGKPIMEDFMAKMKEKPDGDITYDAALVLEIQKREKLLDEYEMAGASKITRYTYGRWTAYSSHVVMCDWNFRGRENPSWWDNFTIADAREFERGRRLVQILESYKRSGKKTIVFASAIFHQQFAAHVNPHQLFADKQVMKLLGYKNVAYIVPQGSYVGGKRLTKGDLKRGIMLIERNECDAAVMSIYVGGAGLNCQSTNSIVFMSPSTSEYQIKQAKGNSFTSSQLTVC